MKKFFILIPVFSLIFLSSFAAWTNVDDYKAYKNAKELANKAEGESDTFNAVANYKKAAELAAKSATTDIQIWQYNNAAYCLIKQFKLLTGYEEKLTKLSEMKPGKDKIAYQSEIANLFNLQMGLLEEAENLLNDAEKLLPEKTEEAESNTLEAKASTPKEKIESNLQFISWVKNFIKDNLKQEEQKEWQEQKAQEEQKEQEKQIEQIKK